MDLVAARLLRLLGLALLLGALVLRRGPAGRERGLRLPLAAGAGTGAALILLGSVLDLLRLSAALTAVPPFSPEAWRALPRLLGGSAYGRALGAGAVLGLLLAACGPWPGRLAGAARGLLAAALAVTFALAGHAATAARTVLAVPLQAVHTGVAAAWLGGLTYLAALVLTPFGRTAAFAAAVRDFSRLAAGGVALMALTGVAVAAGRLFGLYDLRETAYGQVLTLKLWWLGAALGLAALNRMAVRRLRQPEAGGSPAAGMEAAAARLLRILVPVEAALVAGVAIAAAVLAQTTPPLGPAQRYVVEMQDYAFVPARLEIPAGRVVRVVVHNRGQRVHDWSVPDLPHLGGAVTGTAQLHAHGTGEDFVHVHVPPGGWAAVEFVALRPGRYKVLCTVWPHADLGMVGELVVREGP